MPGPEDVAAAAAKDLLPSIWRWLLRFRRSAVRLCLEEGQPFEMTHPADAAGLALRTLRIEVSNAGQEALQCLAKLERMERSDGKPFGNSFLPIGLSTQHQEGEGRTRGLFNLRAGEKKLLSVASLNEADPSAEIRLHYETDAYPNPVPRGSYRIGISVYGGHKPATINCRLYVDGRGQLKLRREA